MSRTLFNAYKRLFYPRLLLIYVSRGDLIDTILHLVNYRLRLVGIFDVAQLKSVFSKEPSYCIKQLLLSLCPCLDSPTNLENVRKLSMGKV